MVKTLLFLLFLIMTKEIFCKEIRYLYRSPFAILMGDAYTSLADDEYTLFYNPGAISDNKGFFLKPLNPDFAFSNVIYPSKLDRFQNLPSNNTAALANRFLDFPIYLHGGISPGLKLGNLGLSFFLSDTTSVVLRNAVHPNIFLDEIT